MRPAETGRVSVRTNKSTMSILLQPDNLREGLALFAAAFGMWGFVLLMGAAKSLGWW